MQDKREEDSESKERETIKLDQAEELTGKEETFLDSKDIVDHNLFISPLINLSIIFINNNIINI